MIPATSSTRQRSTDPRLILDRAIATGAAVVAGVGPDQFTAPTPCPEMDVRVLLSHLVGVLDRIAALGNGEDPFSVIETQAPADDWSDAWAKSGTNAAAAWRDDAMLDRPMALPWIQGNGADVLTSYFSERPSTRGTSRQRPVSILIGTTRSSPQRWRRARSCLRRTAERSSRRSRPPGASTRSPSRSPRPSPCKATPPPSIASSPGTAGIPVSDPAAPAPRGDPPGCVSSSPTSRRPCAELCRDVRRRVRLPASDESTTSGQSEVA